MKTTKIVIAAGMLMAGIAAASAESVYEQGGSGIQGQTANMRDQQVTIRYLSGTDAAATARSEQPARWLPSGSVTDDYGYRPHLAPYTMLGGRR